MVKAEVVARRLRQAASPYLWWLKKDVGSRRASDMQDSSDLTSLAEKCGVPPRRLARWLDRGITRTRGEQGRRDLENVCAVLGITVEGLWADEPPQEVDKPMYLAHWVRQIYEIIDRRSTGERSHWHLVIDLMLDIQQRYYIAMAADKMAKEHPELVPEEMTGQDAFDVFWSIAERLKLPDDGQYERLYGLLTAMKALDTVRKSQLTLRVPTPPIPPGLSFDEFLGWLNANRHDLGATREPRHKDRIAKIEAAYKAAGSTLEAVKILEDAKSANTVANSLANWLADLDVSPPGIRR